MSLCCLCMEHIWKQEIDAIIARSLKKYGSVSTPMNKKIGQRCTSCLQSSRKLKGSRHCTNLTRQGSLDLVDPLENIRWWCVCMRNTFDLVRKSQSPRHFMDYWKSWNNSQSDNRSKRDGGLSTRANSPLHKNNRGQQIPISSGEETQYRIA